MLQRLSLFLVFVGYVLCCCPAGYTEQSNGICYKLHRVVTTRFEASQICIAEGAVLAEIPDATTKSVVVNYMENTHFTTQVWMGATCYGSEISSCKFDTGRNMTFDDFPAGGPSQTACVYLTVHGSDSHFASAGCTEKLAPLCQYKEGVKAIACPPQYSIFAGNCYKAVFGAQGLNEQSCVANGGFTASIHSIAENTFVQQLGNYMIRSNACYYGPPRLGLYFKNGTWQWTDGTPLDFNIIRPNPAHTCMMMDSCKWGHGEGAINAGWVPCRCDGYTVSVCKTAGNTTISG